MRAHPAKSRRAHRSNDFQPATKPALPATRFRAVPFKPPAYIKHCCIYRSQQRAIWFRNVVVPTSYPQRKREVDVTTASRTPDTAEERLAALVAACGGMKRESGQETICVCPAHDDENPSLNIRLGDNGNLLVKCRANCTSESIVKAIGWQLCDLMGQRERQTARAGKQRAKKPYGSLEEIVEAAARWKKGRVESTHTYHDADSRPAFAVIRVRQPNDEKEIPQVRPQGEGWVFGGIGKNRPLYGMPEFLNADPATPVLFFEGEQKADLAQKLGFLATCASQGSGNAKLTDFAPLAGRQVVLFPDNDDPGKQHANDVADLAYRAGAASVQLATLPDLPPKGDIVDYYSAKQGDALDDAAIIADLESVIAAASAAPCGEAKGSPSSADEHSSTDRCVALGEVDPETGRVVLSPNRTLPTAQAFLRDNYLHERLPTLVTYADALWVWKNNRYEQIEDGAVQNQLYPWLHDALRYYFDRSTKTLRLIDFESNPGSVKAALATIKSESFIPACAQIPFWRGTGTAPALLHELLPCKSKTLHIPTRQVSEPTPELFAVNALEFDYDPKAARPTRWLAFLDELFGDDRQAIELLQEWVGYCLTNATSQQKMMLMVGPRRSGKGTIARVMRQLIGENNIVSPTVSSIASNFGLQPLLGKTNAIVSDARFSGDGVAVVIERLLCISGEDAISVDRKFLNAVNLKLSTRFTFLTNELPRLMDASSALTGRFLVLRLTKSFYGQEDTHLTDALLTELPGILLWALDGWDRLHKRGHFVQPASSEQEILDLEDLSSPVKAFVREMCDLRIGSRTTCSSLYAAWVNWCRNTGGGHQDSKPTFGKDLKAATGLSRRRDKNQVGFYDGIELKTEADA